MQMYYKCNTNVIYWQLAYILMLFQFDVINAAARIEQGDAIILSFMQFKKHISYQPQ